MTRRQLALVSLLLATLAATWWASTIDESASDPAAVPSARAPRVTHAVEVRAGRAQPADGTVPRIERSAWPLSAATVMEPPTVRAAGPSVVPPSPAGPPPLPFVFVGAIEDGGRRTAILMEGPQVLLVEARQRIDTRYRVERVSATNIEFTYLPLEQKQVLDIAGVPGDGG